MSQIAKIVVEKFDSKAQILYSFDKTKGLCGNINILCKQLSLPQSRVYGLKYIPTESNNKNYYLSDKNLHELKDTDCLKLVFSLKYILQCISRNIHEQNNLDLRSIVFEDILKLSSDFAFIDELVATKCDKLFLEVFVNEALASHEELALLRTINTLITRGKLCRTSPNALQKALDILNNHRVPNEELEAILTLFYSVLMTKNKAFQPWKEKILTNVTLDKLNIFSGRIQSQLKVSYCKEVQYSVLLLINSMIGLSRGEKKKQLIDEMNRDQTRENIYRIVILQGDLDRNMERELFVLQTYLLRSFRKVLRQKIDLNDKKYLNRMEFELCPEDLRRITFLTQFSDPEHSIDSCLALENMAFNFGRANSRISMKSDEGTECHDFEDIKIISRLTLQALSHYKNTYPQDFYNSQIEEKLYQTGIFSSSEKVVQMLAEILHSGKNVSECDRLDRESTFYQPLVFRCLKYPFFPELFSKTMVLLSRTRHEMKAFTKEEFPNVAYILKRQMLTILEARPQNFESLRLEMSKTSYKTLRQSIEKEAEEEVGDWMAHNQCVQELKTRYLKENETYALQCRINILLQGHYFPKVKDQNDLFVKLSPNLQKLLVYEVDWKRFVAKVFYESIVISDITHIVIGKNCNHSDLCKGNEAPFSIIADHQEKIKCIVKDEKFASYWTDALLLLTNKATPEKLSKYYTNDLNELATMDLRLQLIEIQGDIKIPRDPPPIGDLPRVVNPPNCRNEGSNNKNNA